MATPPASLPRARLLERVATHVPPASREDCVRVAVDGVDGSGKTWFADDLAAILIAAGRQVVRVSVDDWHHTRAHRYARGRTSPIGFWLDSYDYDRLRQEVLEPLGPDGSRWFRRKGHDLHTDRVLHAPPERAPAGAVVLVDGLFLQRAELQDCFELTIWLEVPFTVTTQRMAARDGTHPDPTHPTMRRYVGGQELYFAQRSPHTRADLVIDNTDPQAPRLEAARPAERTADVASSPRGRAR
ncbi:uridine kinase [Nostocoides sp. HKS02]|uniref:uridine kinase n=1 Tax=Nostocoides sp. HKS02 TaxID=1813880 RepID=UPI0018A7F6B5|nr:uridine kinase [Tetrasphaera sp. HKS02]